MNGLALIALIVLAIGAAFVYRTAMQRCRDDRHDPTSDPIAAMGHPVGSRQTPVVAMAPGSMSLADTASIEELLQPDGSQSRPDAERARLIRSYEARAEALVEELAARDAERVQLSALAEDRRKLLAAIADAKAEAARYRDLLVAVENDAPARFLGAPGSTDDLKLIVGVGPVLERMLHQLGVTTYRQIARWSERDIDDIEHRLTEFPGRIRRDAWVTQAHALHQSKYGEPLPPPRAR